jgi:transcription initiation factor TFIIB
MTATILLNTSHEKDNFPGYSNDVVFPTDTPSLQKKESNSSVNKMQTTSIIPTTCTATSTKCPICNTEKRRITDPVSGEIVCSGCGMVVFEGIEETRQEWRNFPSEEELDNRVRTGAPTSLARHDRGLYTVIGHANRDAAGNKIDTAMRSRMEKLRIWDVRTQVNSSADRGLRHAFSQLDILKDKLGLSDTIVEKTAYIYRKAQQRRLTRGRTVLGILAAAVYIACRELGVPRTLQDIAYASNNRPKEVARDYRLLYYKLGLKVPMADPMGCIAKIASRAQLNEVTKRHAINMMRNVIAEEKSAGKDPMGLAAAVLYLSSLKYKQNNNVSQTQLSHAAGVTEVTIRNRAKDLKKSGVLLSFFNRTSNRRS